MLLTYLPLIIFFIGLLIAIIIYVKGHETPLAKHFAIITLAASIWSLTDYLASSAANAQISWYIGGLRTILSFFAFNALFHFVLRFINFAPIERIAYQILLYIPVAFAGYLRLFTNLIVADVVLVEGRFSPVPGQLQPVIGLYYATLTIAMVILLFVNALHQADKSEHILRRNLTAMLSFPLLIAIATNVVLPIFGIDVAFIGMIAVVVTMIPLLLTLVLTKSEVLLPLNTFTGSIKAKMFTTGLVAPAVTLLIGMFILFATFANNLSTTINNQLILIQRSHLDLLTSHLDVLETHTWVISRHETLIRYALNSYKENNPYTELAQEKLHELTSLSDTFVRIEIVNLENKVLLAQGDYLPSLPISENAIEKGRSVFSDIAKYNDYYYHSVSSPIFNSSGDTIAYVSIYFEAEKVYEHVIHETVFNRTERAYLVNEQGKLVSPLSDYPESLLLNEVVASQAVANCNNREYSKDVSGDILKQTYLDFRNVRVIGNATAILNTPWCLIVETDEREARAPLTTQLTVTMSIGIAALLIMTLLADRLGTLFATPIKTLAEKTKQISDGNYNVRVNIDTNDEIGELAQSFDTMAKRLKSTQESITEKVLSQTKDLIAQRESLIQQQKRMVKLLNNLEDEKEKSDELAQDLMKFQLAVANASDHIIITDPEGSIIYANEAVHKITGFSPDEIIGQKAGSKSNWGGLMSQAFYEKFWKTIKIKKKPFSGEVINHHKDGTQYTVYATVSPVLNNKGEIVFYTGIERDITKEKEIDRAKSEFVSLASHQLRTPLSAINWYTEMLLDGDAGELNEQQKTYLTEIYKGNKRMVDLVTSLLNVSRLEMQSFSIEPVPTNLVDLAEEALKELTQLIVIKNLSVNKEYGRLPLVKVDKKLMFIIFQNLLSNAVKYTPDGGKISISIKKGLKHFVIEIQDTGMGIPKEQQEHVFEKLFRADNAKELVTEGTGLGLYIVKSILDKAKGKIAFTSEKDKGTTFTVKIPLKGMKAHSSSKALS